MGYFDYPLDTKRLLRKKKAIRRELLRQDTDWMEKKVAILGGSTTAEAADQMENALLYYGIKAQFYQSDYGRYWEDALFGNPVLDAFAPDIIYIHTNWRNIRAFPPATGTEEDAERLLAEESGRFAEMWDALEAKFGCPVIQNNFERPDYRLLGNRDIWDVRGRSHFISALNQEFYRYAQGHSQFYIHDLEYTAQDYGLARWNDADAWNLYRYFCPVDAIPLVAKGVADIIKSIYGKDKKLLALDLDGTLWGGIIGEDGLGGIRVGTEMPDGRAYLAFQEYCKALQERGVVLAVDSKNNEADALEGLGHPDGVLRRDDFVSFYANWMPKDRNLRDIAGELSLGAGSFVFVDDNPAERELVRAGLPEVSVPEADGPEAMVRALDRSAYFEAAAWSKDDMEKTRRYQARARAASERAAFADYGQYLESLRMEAEVTGFGPEVAWRVAQLTNKTNQFNLTTRRCSEGEIQKMQDDPAWICLCGRLSDKFAGHGIVAVAAGEVAGDTLHIRLFLLSCRVLQRGMEDVMLGVLAEKARELGARKMVGYYHPTKKNGMVSSFYQDRGFALEAQTPEGGTVWSADLDHFQPRGTKIALRCALEGELPDAG